MTPHIKAKKEDIKETVIMPGDPLRAKMIADNYLTEVRLVNDVRGMLAYTGKYNGVELTVMASGMGNPSMGIYSYELYKYYDVKNIIRIGTCGSYTKELNPYDVVLVAKTYSDSNFALIQNGYDKDTIDASSYLNMKITLKAQELNIPLSIGTVHCSDVYYGNTDYNKLYQNHACLGVEMESFALFNNARILGKNAATILTISNSLVTGEEMTNEERQNSLKRMIELALKTMTE